MQINVRSGIYCGDAGAILRKAAKRSREAGGPANEYPQAAHWKQCAEAFEA